MKRKKMVYLMAIMMVTMLSLGLVSCDSDDDDDNVKITSPIVGTWKTGISSVNATVVFNSDATVIWNSTINGKTKHDTGTYDVSSGSDGIVKIYWSSSDVPEIWKFTITGNTMKTTGVITSSGTLTWTKQ